MFEILNVFWSADKKISRIPLRKRKRIIPIRVAEGFNTGISVSNPPIYLHLIFEVLNIKFDELDFFPRLNWIFLPALACKIPVHQNWYFKLKNCKNREQIWMDKILQAFKPDFANYNYPKKFQKNTLEFGLKDQKKKKWSCFFRNFFLKTKPIKFKV